MRNKTIILTAAVLLSISGAALSMRRGDDGIAQVTRGDVSHVVVAPSVVEPASERIALALVKEGTRSEMRREAEAAVDAAAAELEEVKTYLAKSELVAPISGVVLRRLAEPGELVTTTPPEVVVAMADLDRLQLRVEIDE